MGRQKVRCDARVILITLSLVPTHQDHTKHFTTLHKGFPALEQIRC